MIRVLKKLATKASNMIVEGGLMTEEILDAPGSAVVRLIATFMMSMPDLFKVFMGKPFPTTLSLIFVLQGRGTTVALQTAISGSGKPRALVSLKWGLIWMGPASIEIDGKAIGGLVMSRMTVVRMGI